jgi:RNA polymerase sigma-70 factor, ECF subfamily
LLEPEAFGLLALMLLTESRRLVRTSAQGDLIVLEEQDRSEWDQDLIAQGNAMLERALAGRPTGPYTVQAAIAAVHANAATAAQTDWREIAGLYDVLFALEPSPVVALNRAVAVAMRDGPQAGLVLIDALMAQGDLASYHLAHAARADLHRHLNNREQARAAYMQALQIVRQEPERRFIERRLRELS